MLRPQTSQRILHHPICPVITSTFCEAKLDLGHHSNLYINQQDVQNSCD